LAHNRGEKNMTEQIHQGTENDGHRWSTGLLKMRASIAQLHN
jgi:hypothetical protein